MLDIGKHRTFIRLVLLLATIALLASFYLWSCCASPVIINYQETFFPNYDKQGKLQIAIRTYNMGSDFKLVVVDPYTFETRVADASEFTTRNFNPTPANPTGLFNFKELEQTPYVKALKRYTDPPYLIENYGIKNAASLVKGVFLTIDMCPSSKNFEKSFFETLAALKQKTQLETPVGIALSGLWALRHLKEFDWLIEQQKKNNLKITWINHSFSHVYYADLPQNENFMLTPRGNFSEEILAVERILLSKGQTPSVFIRFPGLVSNENLIEQLKRFSLIPIGTDAWLAHDEPVKEGSIILVHGNSNEPKGIELLMPLITGSTPLNLLPLSEAFEK